MSMLLLSSLHSRKRNGGPHSVVHSSITHPFNSIPSPSGPNTPPLDQGCRGPSIVLIIKVKGGLGVYSYLLMPHVTQAFSSFIWALFHRSPLCIFGHINLYPLYNCLFHRSFIVLLYLTQLSVPQKDILLANLCLCWWASRMRKNFSFYQVVLSV